MNIVFLYPSSSINTRQVDDLYAEEYLCAKQAGFNVHCFDIENIESSIIFPSIPDDSVIIYRGYMLNEDLYTRLEKRFGSCLVTSKNNYLNVHYFPNWYNEIKAFTIPSVISNENLVLSDFEKFGGRAFVKDYVKSLKTGKGSIVSSIDDLKRTLSQMKHYRGSIEGGVVLRQVVNFKPGSEIRFFVVNGTIFYPGQKVDPHMYTVVQQVVRQLGPKKLFFYTVDVAVTQDDRIIVVEVGDGQVSDYVGWELRDFIKVLHCLVKALDHSLNQKNR